MPLLLFHLLISGLVVELCAHEPSWHPYEPIEPLIPQDVMVDVINNLGLSLLEIQNRNNENNIALSPYGAASVLVTLREGIADDAMYEIQNSARLPRDLQVIRVGMRDIHRHLKSYFIPKEGFLAGLTFSHENVTLKKEYEDVLRFYGYDADSFNTALYPDPSSTSSTELISRSSESTTNSNTESESTIISESSISSTFPGSTFFTESTISSEPTTLSTLINPSESSFINPGDIYKTTTETTTLTTGYQRIENEEETQTSINTTHTDLGLMTTSTTLVSEENKSVPNRIGISETSTIVASTQEITTMSTSTETTITPIERTSANTIIVLDNASTVASTEGTSVATLTDESTAASMEEISTTTTSPTELTVGNNESTVAPMEGTAATTTTVLDNKSTVAATERNSVTTTLATTITVLNNESTVAPTEETLPTTTIELANYSTVASTERTSTSMITMLRNESTAGSTEGTSDTTTSATTITVLNNESPVVSTETTTASTITVLVNESTPGSTKETSVTTTSSNTITIVNNESTVASTEGTAATTTTMLVNESTPGPTEETSVTTTSATTITVVNNESTVTLMEGTAATTVTVLNNGSAVDLTEGTSPTTISVTTTMVSGTEKIIVPTEETTTTAAEEISPSSQLSSEETIPPGSTISSTNISETTETTISQSTVTMSTTEETESIPIDNFPVEEVVTKNAPVRRALSYYDETNAERGNDEITNGSISYNDREPAEGADPELDNNTQTDFISSSTEINSFAETDTGNLTEKPNVTISHVTLGENNIGVIRSTRSIVDYIIARHYDAHSQSSHSSQGNERQLTFLINGKTPENNINFMTYDTVLPFYYALDLEAVALSFPLDSTKYYLLLIMPTNIQGIDKLVCDLDKYGSLKHIVQNLKYNHVKATIPSFMLKGFVILTPALQKLGIQKIFEPRRADFSPMTNDTDIYVTNIEQAITVTIRNYVDPRTLDDHGNLRRYDPVEFKADHPFLYFVMDSDIHVTLMAGKIINPLNSRIR